jgi:hypothetical protein
MNSHLSSLSSSNRIESDDQKYLDIKQKYPNQDIYPVVIEPHGFELSNHRYVSSHADLTFEKLSAKVQSNILLPNSHRLNLAFSVNQMIINKYKTVKEIYDQFKNDNNILYVDLVLLN